MSFSHTPAEKDAINPAMLDLHDLVECAKCQRIMPKVKKGPRNPDGTAQHSGCWNQENQPPLNAALVVAAKAGKTLNGWTISPTGRTVRVVNGATVVEAAVTPTRGRVAKRSRQTGTPPSATGDSPIGTNSPAEQRHTRSKSKKARAGQEAGAGLQESVGEPESGGEDPKPRQASRSRTPKGQKAAPKQAKPKAADGKKGKRDASKSKGRTKKHGAGPAVPAEAVPEAEVRLSKKVWTKEAAEKFKKYGTLPDENPNGKVAMLLDILCFSLWEKGPKPGGAVKEMWEVDGELLPLDERTVGELNTEVAQRVEGVRRAAKFLAQGEISKSTHAMFSSGTLPLTEETKDLARRKYPSRPEDSPHPQAPEVSREAVFEIEEDKLFELTNSKSVHLARDAYGWKYEHIHLVEKYSRKEVSVEEGFAIRAGLCKLVNDVAKGTFLGNEEAEKALRITRCVMLRKPPADGRPIGIGCLWTQIPGLCLFKEAIARDPGFETVLGLHELSVGAKGGSEVLVHAVRAYLELNPTHVVLKLDATNAFNSLKREAILKQVEKWPWLGPYIALRYGGPGEKRFEDREGRKLVISGDCGLDQGDGVAPLLYAGAHSEVIETTQQQHPSVVIPNQADDAYLMGDLESVIAALLETYKPTLKEDCGVDINELKSKLVCGSEVDKVAAKARCVEVGLLVVEGFNCGGSFVGTDEYVRREVKAKVDGIADRLESLRLLVQHGLGKKGEHNGKQWASHLLRQSLVPAAVHLLRTTPPAFTKDEGARLDWANFKLVLELAYWDEGKLFWGSSEPRQLSQEDWAIISANPSPQALLAKARMHLRVGQGGAGITSLADIAEPAHGASILLSAFDIARRGFLGPDFSPSRDGEKALPHFASIIQKNGLAAVADLEDVTCTTVFEKSRPGMQAKLTEAARAPAYQAVLTMLEGDPQAKANFLSMATPEAGACLLASPAVKPWVIHDAEFGPILRSRLVMPQVPGLGGSGQPGHILCTASSERTNHRVSSDGGHAMVCHKAVKANTARHNALRDGIHGSINRAANSSEDSNLSTVKEPNLEVEALWQRVDQGEAEVATEPEDVIAGGAGRLKKDQGKGDILLKRDDDPLKVQVLDMAIVHPGLSSHPNASKVAGTAAEARWKSKESQYRRRWGQLTTNGAVVPIIVETGGRWHAESFKFLKSLFKDLGAMAAFRDMIKQTSVQLQRHNARAWRALAIRSRTMGEPGDGHLQAMDLRVFFGPVVAGAYGAVAGADA